MDISEGWGMVTAAWVAAGAAVYGARVTYKASRQSIADQGLYEHRLWKRQARMEAYQAFMAATEKALDELDKRQKNPAASDAGIVGALDGLLAAQAGVRLVGPHEAFLRAREVTEAVARTRRFLARPAVRWLPTPSREWTEMVRGIVHEQTLFVVFAAGVLDDPEQ